MYYYCYFFLFWKIREYKKKKLIARFRIEPKRKHHSWSWKQKKAHDKRANIGGDSMGTPVRPIQRENISIAENVLFPRSAKTVVRGYSWGTRREEKNIICTRLLRAFFFFSYYYFAQTVLATDWFPTIIDSAGARACARTIMWRRAGRPSPSRPAPPTSRVIVYRKKSFSFTTITSNRHRSPPIIIFPVRNSFLCSSLHIKPSVDNVRVLIILQYDRFTDTNSVKHLSPTP